MSESKHTSGPWKACKQGACSCGTVWSIASDVPIVTAHSGADQFLVARANTEWGDGPDLIYGSVPLAQAQANARLISAAPDMLEALQAALEMFDPAGFEPPVAYDCKSFDEWCKTGAERRAAIDRQIRTALAKAAIEYKIRAAIAKAKGKAPAPAPIEHIRTGEGV